MRKDRFCTRMGVLAAAVVIIGTTQSSSTGAILQLPNMKPLAPYDFNIAAPDDASTGTRALRFSVNGMNVGDHALDLVGLPPHDTTHTAALQCVEWAASHVCSTRQEVGEFGFDARHQHWHFTDYALYEVRTLVEGKPDMSDAGLVAGPGSKVSFCLMDSARVPDGAQQSGLDGMPFYAQCVGVLQGISAHWQDEYGWGLAGQQVVIDDVPDGIYALVVTINPTRRLLETSYADNSSYQVFALSEGGTVVDVLQG